MHRLVACFFVLACSLPSQAGIQTKIVEYRDGNVVLEGLLAWDDAITKAPGILIVHQWSGQTGRPHRGKSIPLP